MNTRSNENAKKKKSDKPTQFRCKITNFEDSNCGKVEQGCIQNESYGFIFTFARQTFNLGSSANCVRNLNGMPRNRSVFYRISFAKCFVAHVGMLNCGFYCAIIVCVVDSKFFRMGTERYGIK